MKSTWSFEVTRGGFFPILIADLVVAYFYFAFVLTDGKQGIPPVPADICLVAIHTFFLLVFTLEFIVNVIDAIRRTIQRSLSKHKETS